MGTFSIWHWLMVVLVVVLLFGGGRISSVMGDVAKGIKSFKRGLADDDDAAAPGGTGTTGTGQPQPQQRITDERPVDTRAAATEQAPNLDKR